MSTYFRALIRSSGMRIGSADTPRDAHSAVSDGLVEIHEERDAASAEQPGMSPARPASTTMKSGPSVTAAADSLAAPAPLSRSDRPAMTRDAVAPLEASPAPASPARAGSRDPLTAPPERTLPAPPGSSSSSLDPVRLAMQWIAADPEARGTAMVPSRSIAPPAPGQNHASPEAAAPRVAAREIGVPAVDDARPAAPMRRPSARTIAPLPVQSVLQPASVNSHHPGRQDGHQDGRRDDRGDAAEETLEISIGAINLHVEAPAPRTVVQPAPPQAAARPRTERSGLHRRYLRSF